jgi:hypothetical protein
MEISFYIKDTGARVPVNAFLDGTAKLLKLLYEVETLMSPDHRAVLSWEIVELKAESALISLAAAMYKDPLPYSGSEVANEVARGLALLEKESIRSPYFPNSAIQAAKELVGVAKVAKITISSQSNVIDLTPKLIANANELLGVTLEAFGTVEGILRTVSTATKNWYFNIYDEVTGLPVRCYMEEDLLYQAATAINHRVGISGLIVYTKEGYPKSIRKVTNLYIFPPDENLPTTDDMLRLDLDLSGGLSLDEFMEKQSKW